MTYSFSSKLTQYLDEHSEKLRQTLFYTPIPGEGGLQIMVLLGAQQERSMSVDMRDMNAIKEYRQDYDDRYTEYHIHCGKTKITVPENGITIIYKMIGNLLKDQKVKQTISEDFIFSVFIEWIVTLFRDQACKLLLSEALLKAFHLFTREYFIHFPLLYLQTIYGFTIGHCDFIYISKEDITQKAEELTMGKQEFYKASMNMMLNHSLVKYRITAEKQQAIARAAEECSLSVSVLKILFASYKSAEAPVIFDLDFKNIHQASQKVMVQAVADPADIDIDHRDSHHTVDISARTLVDLEQLGLSAFHHFLLDNSTTGEELKQLISIAIRKYAEAVSYPVAVERVSKVFTTLESLLLINNDVPIIESLVKYLPKIITTDVQKRTEIIKAVKALYGVRSSYVHHAKQPSFEIADLKLLYDCTRQLILILIQKAASGKTKADILKEVDERIHAS